MGIFSDKLGIFAAFPFAQSQGKAGHGALIWGQGLCHKDAEWSRKWVSGKHWAEEEEGEDGRKEKEESRR